MKKVHLHSDMDSGYFSGTQITELKGKFPFFKFCKLKKVPVNLPGGLAKKLESEGGEFYFHFIEKPDYAVVMSDKRSQIFYKDSFGLTLCLEELKDYLDVNEVQEDMVYCTSISSSEHIDYVTTPLLRHNENIYPFMYPEIDIEQLTQEYLKSEAPLLILSGPAGCGKTTFIKYLSLHTKEQNIFVIGRVNSMSKVLTHLFERNETGIIVLDDAFEDLSDRNDRNNLVNAVISFTAGFRNQCKIVITTNKPQKELNPALIRPGRCFDTLQINPMNREYAAKIGFEHFDIPSDYWDTLPNIITQVEFLETVREYQYGKPKRSYIRSANSTSVITEKPKLGF